MSKAINRDFERAYKKSERKAKNSKLGKKEFERLVLKALKKNMDINQDKELMEELMKIDYVNEFPEEMYGAVAEILAFIYSMDAKKRMESQN